MTDRMQSQRRELEPPLLHDVHRTLSLTLKCLPEGIKSHSGDPCLSIVIFPNVSFSKDFNKQGPKYSHKMKHIYLADH